MQKNLKHPSAESSFPKVPSFTRQILPLKQKFFTFQSKYKSQADFQPTFLYIRSKNPKWCHLSLKFGQAEQYEKYTQLQRASSLRLRSVHLESFKLNQNCDRVNHYLGELDVFTRAGNALKKLSLSVVARKDDFVNNSNAVNRLKKFVKKQKHLDEFGLYLGGFGNSKWMSNMLKYTEKTVKTLTIGNMTVEKIFSTYKFPKLETLRFEYMQFARMETTFSFDILKNSLEEIMAFPSLKTLVFSQYQLDNFKSWIDYGAGIIYWPKEGIELNSEFWEFLRAELDKNTEKPLRIKYHKKDDWEILQKVMDFRRIFQGLPKHQTFEYEVVRFEKLSLVELAFRGLEVNGLDHWRGIRYLT